jgi:hypothetical protein
MARHRNGEQVTEAEWPDSRAASPVRAHQVPVAKAFSVVFTIQIISLRLEFADFQDKLRESHFFGRLCAV